MTDLIEVASDILPGTWREGADHTKAGPASTGPARSPWGD